MQDIPTFGERLENVRERIAGACSRAGRNPEEVQLVAVSKGFGPEDVREAYSLGLAAFGESKVQEARAKIPECPEGISWHLIGHLQSNKIKHAVRLFDVVHSVDSIKLLDQLDEACDVAGRIMRVFLEVNVSGEKSKFGMNPDQAAEVVAAALNCSRLEPVGLMTMAPLADKPEKARGYFRKLRELRDKWNSDFDVALNGLSMGMTNDFEVAIEEGATLVRIGTALFDGST